MRDAAQHDGGEGREQDRLVEGKRVPGEAAEEELGEVGMRRTFEISRRIGDRRGSGAPGGLSAVHIGAIVAAQPSRRARGVMRRAAAGPRRRAHRSPSCCVQAHLCRARRSG